MVQNGCTGIETTALLDTGCEVSLITQELAEGLKLEGPTRSIRLGTFHGKDPTLLIRLSSCKISSCSSTTSFTVPKMMVVPFLKVADRYVDWSKEKLRWRHLADLPLNTFDSRQVGIFIGVNVVGALQQLDVRAPKDNGPYAVLTPFGWTVMGEIPASLNKRPQFHCQAVFGIVEDESSVIEQFWQFESLGSTVEKSRTRYTEEEELAIDTLRRTIRNIGGRYEIGLPWKSKEVKLPNNFSSALKRLYATESRFRADKEFAKRYTRAIETNIQLGFARRLRLEELAGPPGRTWYIPTFLVTSPNKPEKPRLVFDAASKHLGVSLNDALINGPVLLVNLHDLLLLFRERPYAVSMDIEKMFLQVRVREEDQAAFRFLWRRPGDEGPPIAYQMMVEIFGASSSPTSCTYVLRRTAEDNKEFSDIAHKVTENFYVDNYLDSFDDAETAINCCHRMCELLKKGGFVLTHLMTSSREIWQSFQPERRANPQLNVDLDDLPVERTLGLLWHGESDTFSFSFSNASRKNTKRGILACVSSVFDPMGFVSCVTLVAKILLQDIWRYGRDRVGERVEKVGWDDTLPTIFMERWHAFTDGLKNLKTLHIPRCLRPTCFTPDLTTYQLHIFCDASTRGYAAIVYLRAQHGTSVSVSLVTARAKVAPVKQQTIPRLELMGAVLGYRLGIRTRRALKLDILNTTWWTDSSTALYWLKSEATLYSTFVACRREEILEDSSPTQWRHVPGELNPADDGSRGVNGTEISIDHRWFQGPKFLKLCETLWPSGGETLPEAEALEEIFPLFVGVLTEEETEIDRLISTSPSLTILERAVAALEQDSDPVSVEQLRLAMEKCVKRVQGCYFQEEIDSLKKNGAVHRGSRVLKLSPFLDERGLLRVGGRLEEAPLPEDSIHPMLLPTTHPFTSLVIKDAHERCLHSQIHRTLYEVQARFWIIRGGRAVHDEVRKCMDCKRRLTKPMQPFMASLPAARLTPDLPPFTHTGVDYFGPLNVVVGRRQEKRYVCLFTCLVTRAVHNEVTVQLDADSFLMAFRNSSVFEGTRRKFLVTMVRIWWPVNGN